MNKSPWALPDRIGDSYFRSLRKIAKFTGEIIQAEIRPGMLPTESEITTIIKRLAAYAELIHNWSVTTSGNMTAEVEHRNRMMWKRNVGTMHRSLLREIDEAPTGMYLREVMAQQVMLIQSIPLEAAKWVQELTIQARMDSVRAPEIIEEIMEAAKVSEGRARRIAITEVGRTDTALTQVRATRVGSEGYIWRTSRDYKVRKSHREMEGTFVAWDNPPTLDKLTGHAGALPFCRCTAEPVIPGTGPEG